MSKKQLAIIILLIIGIIVFLIGIYLLFFRQPTIGPAEPNLPSFGQAPTSTQPSTTIEQNSSSTANNNTDYPFIPRLVKLSLAPVAGASTYVTKIGSTTVETVRYTDIATGNTYDIQANGENRIRQSITTISKVQHAVWSGASVILQKVGVDNETIQSYLGKLTPAQSNPLSTSTVVASGVLSASALPANIQSLTLSPAGDQAFMLISDENGAQRGVISKIDFAQPRELFLSDFGEWTASWPASTTLALTTKPSSGIPGYFYFVNTTNGQFRKIFTGSSGMSAQANASTSLVLYSTNNNGLPVLRIFDIAQNKNLSVTLNTLADKCVWSAVQRTIAYCAVPLRTPTGPYPEGWYQGKILFSDNLYKIDTVAGTATLLYTLPPTEPIDGINLFLTKNDSHLLFMNKRDFSLWALDLSY